MHASAALGFSPSSPVPKNGNTLLPYTCNTTIESSPSVQRGKFVALVLHHAVDTAAHVADALSTVLAMLC